MFSNDTIRNNCDTSTTTSKEVDAGDENINNSSSSTSNFNNMDQLNDATIITRDLQQKETDINACDISLMNCDQEENNRENEELHQSEEDDDIYYESTNESKTCEEDNSIHSNNSGSGVDDCGLSKLYLNDIPIDSNEEEQTITDLVNVTEKDKLIRAEQNKSMRVAFGVILRFVFPLANGVIRGIKGIRDIRFLRVLRSLASSRQALTNLVAFAANTISMNLSSVQVSHRIEPILNLLKIRKSRDGIESLPDSSNGTEVLTPPLTPTFSSPFTRQPRYSLPIILTNRKKASSEEHLATKCCTMNILAEPPPGEPIRADIIFIHGLHGSLVNTWKQGLWENERRPVEFQRPPKPPIRPPKRPRHSRTTTLHPPHHQKRARFCQANVHQKHTNEKDSLDEGGENSYTFICGEAKNIQVCDGIEYSFPTFRLRMNDNGRLIQTEQDFKLHENKIITPDAKEECENSGKSSDNRGKRNKTKPTKPSSDDPTYSKCWPGDWLPLDCPGVRVIAINYTTDPHLWRPLWKKKEPRSNLIQRSREMADLLVKERVGYGHPIIWVGHSKGGLYIKQMIVDAWESGRPAVAPFWRSARGAFFYSVPHRGSHLASIKAPLLVRSVELLDIEKNNKYLLDLHRRFAGLYHLGHLKIEVFSFVETALTLMSVLFMRIVGVDSADPGIGDVCGIRLDHREICKPRSRDCILYKQLVNMINKVC